MKDISIKDLALLIAKLVKYEGQIHWDKSRPDGSPKKLLSIDNFKNMGWAPHINLEDGISSLSLIHI